MPEKERFAAFAGAVFGRFPSDDALQYFLDHYRGALDAAPFKPVAASLSDVLKGEVGTPLQLGRAELDGEPYGGRTDPILFLMDANAQRDLIDYWNLRALGWHVIPVPIQWQDELLDVCNAIIKRQHVPRRWQPEFMHSSALLASRSLTGNDARKFVEKLDLPGNDAVVGAHYPRIWDDWARAKDLAVPCTLDAGSSEEECDIEEGRITLKALSPRFSTSFGPPGFPMWVNIVHLLDSLGSEVATIFPQSLPDVDRLLDTMQSGRESTRVTSEGIVTLCDLVDRTNSWKVLDGVTVFQAWLMSHGLNAELSGAGRICLQMIRQLRGVLGAHLIANAEVLRLLDSMAHGTLETNDDETPNTRRKPKTQGRAVGRAHVWGILMKVHNNHKISAARHFERITELGVLRCGLKLKCPNCAQNTWSSLEQIAAELTCDRCLQMFPFPAARPPEEPWAYRTQGSFSIENYAQGAYAVAITLRFFLAMLTIRATWTPSLKLQDEDGEFEIDFAMWPQAHHGVPLVIGECKSFHEKFKPNDLRRATDLGQRFPGALLVFATLREELEPSEKRRLARLARAGRRRTKADKWRTPVMVLTAHELMGRMRPPHCWKDAGGAMAEFAKHYRITNSLVELCDATQQLHLGMESDAASQHTYFERLETRRQKARGGRPPDTGGLAQ